MLGLRDAVLSGWFNQETDELFSGFPISAEDTVLDVGCGDGLGGGAGRRDDLLEEVQHEVAPEVVATRRAALRRLTRREPRSRQGLSTKR
ncbi:hypothetical protein PAERUG_P12_London_17_VIM_2_11_09_04363 [Pseudomonas aeruginosa]|nr:hypothetical protein PAERUG_P12_London_17_VIM_2_11_09_04363 [Pseudomonas aeruginosa]